MPKKGQKTQRDFSHTWHFVEWAESCGKVQADAIRELGWSRAKASDVWNGQPYSQAIVDEVAPWLNVRPFELFMTPKEANSLRSMREAALTIVSGSTAQTASVSQKERHASKTGTTG